MILTLSTLAPRSYRFACVGDYFAGSVFVVTPSMELYRRLVKEARGRRYLYGEQDFLNDFFRKDEDRVVLSSMHYNCPAEDFGYEDRIAMPTKTCKIVEFASCNRQAGAGVRWKPWMIDDYLLVEGAKICRRAPTEQFWELVGLWREIYYE